MWRGKGAAKSWHHGVNGEKNNGESAVSVIVSNQRNGMAQANGSISIAINMAKRTINGQPRNMA
jgi:hypothetical protein